MLAFAKSPVLFAVQKLYVLQSLSMLKPKKPLQQMLKENQSVVKEACLEYLRPKEYHCLCTGRYWREKQRNTEFYSSQALPKANPDKKDAAEYLHDSRLNLLHVLVNIAGQPFETGVLEVSWHDLALRLLTAMHDQECATVQTSTCW